MPRLLVIKTSSLGDVVHALPAVSDASSAYPNLIIDWVVEEAFQEIPNWHSAVATVIPVAIRRWRKNLWQLWRSGEWQQFQKQLKLHHYDSIIDAQGLLKSAWIGRLAQGTYHGFAKNSAREAFASYLYRQTHTIEKQQHAIIRVRQLFAKALNYTITDEQHLNYGILPYFQKNPTNQLNNNHKKPSVLCFHATTWSSKHWPESYWVELIQLLTKQGLEVLLPWGNLQERQTAQRFAQVSSQATVLPKTTLTELAQLLSTVKAVVGVDTGLCHLAAALHIPSITIYGSTQPAKTGTLGQEQQHLPSNFACAPCLRRQCDYTGLSRVKPACYQELTPKLVWEQLQRKLN